MKAKRIFMIAFLAAITLGSATCFAQPAAVRKIIETGKADNRTMHHLDIITNRFGGRLIGSDAYENAGTEAVSAANKNIVKIFLKCFFITSS